MELLLPYNMKYRSSKAEEGEKFSSNFKSPDLDQAT